MRFLNDIDGSEKVKQDVDNRFVTDSEKKDIGKIKDKADKTYVDDRVKTPVPIGALFTDTVSTKDSLGLENVENKSAEQILNELTKQKITDKLGYTPVNIALKGVAGGLAELNEGGKIPAAQLPSYVDDVMEFPTLTEFPKPGEKGKIYTAKDTNVIYRWSGTEYVEISASLALGDSEGTAYPGDLGKIAYDHSQATHAPIDAQKNSLITKGEIEDKLTGVINTHRHTVNKSDVGLSEVDNTSDLNKPVSTLTQVEIDAKTKVVADDLAGISQTLTTEQERIAEAQQTLANDLNNRVKTNVPLNAEFTDTITTVNGKTGVISKADIIALGISEEGIPGEKGDKGEPGDPGPKGDVGPRGPQGIQGIQGPKGEKGNPFIYSDFTSAQLTALKGPKGDTGPRGPQGEKGDPGTEGPQGIRGLTGPKGDTGERGPQGFKGDVGETGPASTIPGPKGDTGPRGPAGSDANITKSSVESALGYSVNKSVPSNAVFTDTKYTSLPANGGVAQAIAGGSTISYTYTNNPPSDYVSPSGLFYRGDGAAQVQIKNGRTIDSPENDLQLQTVMTYTADDTVNSNSVTQVLYGNSELYFRVSTSMSQWGSWQSLRGLRGIEGPQGPRGFTGSDATVTEANVRSALSSHMTITTSSSYVDILKNTLYIGGGVSKAWHDDMTETGSSNRGQWVKYPDGTMICTFWEANQISVSYSRRGTYYRAFYTDYFPQRFNSDPVVITDMTIGIDGGMTTATTMVERRTTSLVEYVMLADDSRVNTILKRGYIAIGRWK